VVWHQETLYIFINFTPNYQLMKINYLLFLLFCPLYAISQVNSITATEPVDLSVYDGTASTAGQGEYQIFLSDDNILDKPIIAVDGFDPGDSRDIATIYASLNFNGPSGTQNLADLLRDQGFDVVILNFPTYTNGDGATIDGGADFMERNAMVLVELINLINTNKAPNNPEQNVVIGPSMGGIISRYALNYMEANGLDSDTRLYISFDSPHLGANIPIGLQHQLNYLAFNDLNPVAEVQPLINDLLNSPAARQLLLDHYGAHLEAGSLVEFDPTKTLPEPHPYRLEFQNRIRSFTTDGFPENTRNVSIVNGSGIGSSYFAIGSSGPLVDNGYPIITSSFDITVPNPLPFGSPTIDVPVTIDVNFTPAAGPEAQVSSFVASTPVGSISSSANSETINFDGVDAAPGGLFDLSDLTGAFPNTGPGAEVLAGLEIDKFNFIPTVSALALEITEEASGDDINWFHNINLAGRATTNTTPFDNTFLPDDNEPHVQLTEANVAFALSEILNPPLSLPDNSAISFKIEQNPIANDLVILSNTTTEAKVWITDLAGKTLFNTGVNLTDRTAIPLNLTSGFYMLNLTTGNNQVFVSKFIVQ
jgi:hypothetical protein